MTVRGAHGIVRKSSVNGSPVAIKECPCSDEARSELGILRELQGHPNVVQLLSVDEAEGSLFLTMEYVPSTLLDMIGEGKRPTESELRNIFFQLLDAISFMHSKSIVHKDIKLENILYTKGRIRLIDFGFSRHFIKGERTLTDNKGSLHYAAPEIWNGLAYEGPSVDIWAMGVTVFLLTTGYFPFGGTTADEIYRDLQLPLWTPKSLTKKPTLMSLLQGMLEPDMSKRFTIEQIYSHPWVASHSLSSGLRKTRSAEDTLTAEPTLELPPAIPSHTAQGLNLNLPLRLPTDAIIAESRADTLAQRSPRITSSALAIVAQDEDGVPRTGPTKRIMTLFRRLVGIQ